MNNFLKLAEGIDVMPLFLELQRQPHLWDQVRYRKDGKDTPHSEMSDVWIRYNDIRPYQERGDYSGLNDSHEAIWYPAYYALPSLRPLIFGLMARVEGERLGGIWITRIPAGSKIAKHTDSGWHVETFEKFYLSLESEPGAEFYCEDEMICPKAGDLYWFDNRRMHWIDNRSSGNRTTLIICIQCHKFRKEG